MTKNPIRIATTKTGSRFIVQNVDFRANVARCWGEVLSFRGLSTTHGPSQTIPLSDVVLSNDEKTVDLLRSLLAQAEGSADLDPSLRDLAHPRLAADRDMNRLLADAFRNDPLVLALIAMDRRACSR